MHLTFRPVRILENPGPKIRGNKVRMVCVAWFTSGDMHQCKLVAGASLCQAQALQQSYVARVL